MEYTNIKHPDSKHSTNFDSENNDKLDLLSLSSRNIWKFSWKNKDEVITERSDKRYRQNFLEETQNYLNFKYLEFLQGNKNVIYLVHNLEYYLLDFTCSVMYPISDKNIKTEIIIEEINSFDAPIGGKNYPSEIEKRQIFHASKSNIIKRSRKYSFVFKTFFFLASLAAILMCYSSNRIDESEYAEFFNQKNDNIGSNAPLDSSESKAENLGTGFNIKENCLDISDVNLSKKRSLNNERKFILGKCNPVLFVPAFLGTKLVASINCPSLVKDEAKLKEMRYFCGYGVCKKSLLGNYGYEEYTLWPVVFNSPFRLLKDKDNRDNSCLAYFMRHFNDENVCPQDPVTQKNLCLYNENIKISFFGDTPQTAKQSQCGIKGVYNVVDPGVSLIPESFVNPPATKAFVDSMNFLKEKGYAAGFSMAGLPYDWRKFYISNETFKDNLEKLVNMLHGNTGKKVIIVALSYGSLNVLRVVNKKNSINDKIKRFITLGPAFLGSAAALESFWTGTDEFHEEFFMDNYIGLSREAQRYSAIFMPASYAMKPKPILHQLSKIGKYKNFIDALKERIDLEKTCGVLSKNYEQICTSNYMRKHSKKFREIFPFFPQFDSQLCQDLRSKIIKEFNTVEFFNKKASARKNVYEYIPSYEGCEIRLYDYLRCPLIKILKQENFNANENNHRAFSLDDMHNECFEKHDEKPPVASDEYDVIFNHDCKLKSNINNCFLDFVKNYTSFDVQSLFNKLDREFPDNLHVKQEEYHRALDTMSESIKDNESIEEFNMPEVPTSIVYSSFIDTRISFVYNSTDEAHDYSKDNVFYFGGDGKISTYSSLTPALKWLYDNQFKENKTNIQVVNYCSYLAYSPEFAFDFTNKTKNKEYVSLKCECLTEEGYDLSKISRKHEKCSHSSMVTDSHIIDYVYSFASDEPVHDKIEKYSKNILNSFNKAISINYEDICNKFLHDFNF